MTAPSDPALKVAHTQEERVVCEHADRCGGCPIIGLPYSEQLALKRGRVVQAVARYLSLELVYTEPVAPATPLVSYRTRAKLIVGQGGKVGLFAKGGGHQVVDIPRCRVLAPVLARVAAELRDRIAEADSSGGALASYDPAGRGALRAIDLRELRDGDSSTVLATLVVQRGRVASIELLQRAAHDLMEAVPEVAGVAVNFHEGDAPRDPRQRDPAARRRRLGAGSRGRIGAPGDLRVVRPGPPGSSVTRSQPACRSHRPRSREDAGPQAARPGPLRGLRSHRARPRDGGGQRPPGGVVCARGRPGARGGASPRPRRRGRVRRRGQRASHDGGGPRDALRRRRRQPAPPRHEPDGARVAGEAGAARHRLRLVRSGDARARSRSLRRASATRRRRSDRST